MAECWLSSGVPACAGAFWMCVACRQAVPLGCGKGGLKVLAILCAAQSGQTTGCVLADYRMCLISPDRIGVMSEPPACTATGV